MKHFTPSQLESAVTAVCPDIVAPTTGFCRHATDERGLWLEFATCLLSSQVPFELASAAAAAVLETCVLNAGNPPSEDDVRDALSSTFLVEGRPRRYRFPRSKAKQLISSWNAIRTDAGGLAPLLNNALNARSAREWLVHNAPGMGPKQASMFLRNVGLSEDLAVLDRHVLEYMASQRLCPPGLRGVSRMPDYVRLETRLRRHAVGLGYTVGRLDRAIWVVMRVARRQARNQEVEV